MVANFKTRISCGTSGFNVDDHFVNINEMVQLGSGSKREISNLALSRYACYLIGREMEKSLQTFKKIFHKQK